MNKYKYKYKKKMKITLPCFLHFYQYKIERPFWKVINHIKSKLIEINTVGLY